MAHTHDGWRCVHGRAGGRPAAAGVLTEYDRLAELKCRGVLGAQHPSMQVREHAAAPSDGPEVLSVV